MFDFEKFPRIETEDALEKATSEVVKYYSKADGREKLHIVLDGCMIHAVKHNDTNRLNNLWNALPVNAPHKLLADWLLRFTNLERREDKAGNVKWLVRQEKGKEKAVIAYELAGSTIPFYAMPSADKAKKSEYSYIDKVLSLIKSGDAHVPKKELDQKEIDLHERIKEAAEEYQFARLREKNAKRQQWQEQQQNAPAPIEQAA